MKLITRTLMLLPMLVALGCSTTQSAPLHGDTSETVNRSSQDPEFLSLGDVPPVGLPAIVHIVIDERPIELSGFGLTRDERAQFANERSRRINARVKQQDRC